MKFLTILLAIIFPVYSYAQDAETVMKNLQQKFETINDFKSSFKQTAQGSFTDEGLVLSGNFYYKKRNKFRVELDHIHLISDGENIWNYDKRLNRVVINSSDENESFLSLDKIIYDYPEQCNLELVEESSSKEFYEIILTPKNRSLEFEYAKIWIDRKNILNKIEITDLSNSIYFFELENVLLNLNMPDSDFNFFPPEGSKVIDFR